MPLAASDLSTDQITKFHYRELYATLSRRGIRYAAMQYPTRSIDELKRLLGDAPDVLFIENRKRFDEACGGDRYSICFSDRFGGSFGHTTVFGHRLIAEDAADAILASFSDRRG